MTISIIGTGNMGRALTRRFATAGETVLLAGQDAQKASEAAKEAARGVSGTVDVVDVDAAIGGGDIVVFATWYPVTRTLAARHAAELDGKVVVDISNPFNESYDGLTTDASTSAAEQIAAAAPGARLVKAFNTTFAPVLAEGEIGGGPAEVLLAGDDQAAKTAVADLARRAGLTVIDAGALANARTLERMTLLLVELQGRYGLAFRAAFRLVPGDPAAIPA